LVVVMMVLVKLIMSWPTTLMMMIPVVDARLSGGHLSHIVWVAGTINDAVRPRCSIDNRTIITVVISTPVESSIVVGALAIPNNLAISVGVMRSAEYAFTVRAMPVVIVSEAGFATSQTTRATEGPSKPVRGIERGTAKSFLASPACLVGPDRWLEASCTGRAAAVREGRVASQRNVVEPEIPDGGVDHSVRWDGHHGAYDAARNHVVPVVEFVDGEGAGY
jgi:hypothetical protein